MKVYVKYPKYNNELGYSTNTNTRVDFTMQDGGNKKLTCKNY